MPDSVDRWVRWIKTGGLPRWYHESGMLACMWPDCPESCAPGDRIYCKWHRLDSGIPLQPKHMPPAPPRLCLTQWCTRKPRHGCRYCEAHANRQRDRRRERRQDPRFRASEARYARTYRERKAAS